FSAKYNHAKIERLANPAFADFHRSTFSANASFRPDKNSRFSFRFADRQIETAASGSSSKFQIASRAYTAGYHVRFNQHFSNDFEAGIKFSREANVKSEIETGFNLREQLRFSWRKNSLTGFFNYTNRTTSLISLIMLNPHLLPVELQPVYALNPAQFLQFHRDRLAYLLPGIVVPQTRNLDAGVRLQTTATRFRLTGEARYGTSAFYSQNQKNLFTSVGVDFRLDAANSIQINGWHSFGANSQQAIVFGFSHRFGSGGGGGFQFSKLFGLNKGKITGRVFEDLNGDGVENSGEIGVSGLIIKLNEKRSIKTDAKGRFQFSTNEGVYNITLVSEDLGVRMQATTAIERKISLDSGQTVNVNFGVSGFGFIAGRVFNESNLAVENPVAKIRGIESVCLLLRSLEPESKNVVATQTSGSGGAYEFRNIRPGKYLLEIDSATLPANFRLPAQSSWEVTVLPLQGFYLDIPFAAQRAVTGFVFIDIDGDGKFDRQRDEPVEGAFITANGVVAVSDSNGAYILRNLPAGKIKMAVRVSTGTESLTVFVEFGAEPATKRAVNFAVAR
ncbi:MAG TPA: SdrD B-like domain-containing protein, partial [Pyrinomonadaceae bacterium]|nr:SdrD B-like domain-containing protein [Pyrinomonadaceae bacterium]